MMNAIGASLLITFTSPGLDVTKTGENMVSWASSPTPKQRVANIRKYKKHKFGFKAGLVLLGVGYVLQFVVAILA